MQVTSSLMGETDSTRINPAHLRALVAVADVRNFSQAALDLQISQSAVSYAIATLEAELGVVLVTRGRHGATLTPVGEKIVEQSRHILQRLESIVQAANVTKGLQGGSLRIACFRSVATHILPALLIKFSTRFPKIAICPSPNRMRLKIKGHRWRCSSNTPRQRTNKSYLLCCKNLYRKLFSTRSLFCHQAIKFLFMKEVTPTFKILLQGLFYL